ncbi:hypothetical protein IFM89_036793 [Coptis chinensis]|uniref:AMP-dependent synthetase/ligase domain-containing protein n=1 Tax=Coptis chinensis TaxID=261450 RepID=A0A835LQC4_9MAGN|nr:hypothetical protein IFM89_036793 [Coptis chinensis]
MSTSTIDSRSGFCSTTKIFHSLRPPVHLPPANIPLSATQYTFALLTKTPSFSPDNTIAFIDYSSGTHLLYSDFLGQVESLAISLRTQFLLEKGDVAFVLSPTSLQIPILYLALLSIGVIVSPANPTSTLSELSRQISLTKPVIAFATSATANKLPSLRHETILLDSSRFFSMLTTQKLDQVELPAVVVQQNDTAVILYSSGTTGQVKGVEMTHRTFIAFLAAQHSMIQAESIKKKAPHEVGLFTVPLFHIYGFYVSIRAVAMGETAILMGRFDFEGMLKAVETHQVTYMPASPPLVVAFAKLALVEKYNLSSLLMVECGGAPLGKEVSCKFVSRFPHIQIVQLQGDEGSVRNLVVLLRRPHSQDLVVPVHCFFVSVVICCNEPHGYGLTEAAGVATMLGPDETKKFGSVGRLSQNIEAKIIDPITCEALPPGKKGELLLRGPTIMKGYVGDDEATANTLNSDGWLKTGDLCYIDSDGFLYVVDRLKELIKYKGYQVPPAELEHLLQSHSEIVDVAVIPLSRFLYENALFMQLCFRYPDEDAGQIPMAFVVAPYKKIRRVAFINSIPKSPAGKILRKQLIDCVLATPSARI